MSVLPTANKLRWYYFDADVLINLDKYGLIDQLEEYKRQTRCRLYTSATIEAEISGKNSKNTSKHSMPASITSAIRGGTIEVRSNVELDKYSQGQIDAHLLQIDDGEISLIKLIIDLTNNSSIQPLLVTNDKDALRAAKNLNIDAQSIANYLAGMATHQLVKCEEAIRITVELLTKPVYHQLTM